MRRKLFAYLSLCLALCLVLSGCAGINLSGYFQQLGALLGGGQPTPFDQMTYARPDMSQFGQTLEQCCAKAETESNMTSMVQIIYDFYGAYDTFYTNFALAMIRYSQDQTDAYWQAEYAFCTQNSSQVDAGLDRFYRVLAKSSLRPVLEGEQYFGPGFFTDYDGESIYDDHFNALLQQETALENQYYDLIAQAGDDFAYTQHFYDTYGQQMAQIFVELIQVRQEQAIYAGYSSYPAFAYDFYHMRDYTVEQSTAYLADIRAELVPLYRQALQEVDVKLYSCSQQDTFAYVQTLASHMGGTVSEAFAAMQAGGLYDISPGENKLDASFEIYIRNYQSPFVFLNPTGTAYDKLTFSHEFGHFCSDYASMGSGAGVDVAEIFSQGMEYLSLIYGPADENLAKLKLLDCLCIFVEQAAYASFEQQVYGLKDHNLTVENIETLYDRVCENYGLNGGFTYLFITHFFTEPMYVISYVVSNDAALQLYQMEQKTTGAGLSCLQANLTTREPYFLAFLQQAGLESPFANGRIRSVKETLQRSLIG